jgi:hypothetical protein
MTETEFYNDRDIAQRLKFSTSWVRVQRHRRARGLPHIFNVEPRYIGASPRYVAEEVEAFFASIAHQGVHVE